MNNMKRNMKHIIFLILLFPDFVTQKTRIL